MGVILTPTLEGLEGVSQEKKEKDITHLDNNRHKCCPGALSKLKIVPAR